MRRLSHAGVTLASVLAAIGLGACGSEGPGEEQTRTTRLGASFASQEAPPAVRRPTGGTLGPRLDPTETPGRWPFYWTRAIYSGYSRGYRRGGSWATDYPKADQQFLFVLKRLVRLNAYDWENAVSLADPDIRRFPVIYAVEVGRMDLTEPEVEGLRSYLDAGGFLIVDDFWGTREWQQFEYNIRRVIPDRPIVDLPLDHPLFSAYYDIEEVLQVPNRSNAAYGYQTHERDGYVPYVRGIYDESGRLSVVINWNTDLGDAWEWAESPYYPLVYSTFAYEMGVNMIVYAMSH
jgi:hypothetical protein